MNRGWLLPSVVFGVLSTLLSLAAGNADTMTIGSAPDQFRWVKVRVDDSDEIVRRCNGWTTTDGTRFWAMVESLRAPSGFLEEGRQIIWESHDLFVRAAVGPLQSQPLVVEGSGQLNHGPSLSRFHPTQDGSVLRVAWAVWGGPQSSCSVEVNGSPVPSASIPLTRARMLLASEMTGVAAVDSSEVSAATLRSYEWVADGYFLASFLGTFVVQGPKDPHPQVKDDVSQRSSGKWQFTLLEKAHPGAMPALVLLNLPS